jgi:hypothetical protein
MTCEGVGEVRIPAKPRRPSSFLKPSPSNCLSYLFRPSPNPYCPVLSINIPINLALFSTSGFGVGAWECWDQSGPTCCASCTCAGLPVRRHDVARDNACSRWAEAPVRGHGLLMWTCNHAQPTNASYGLVVYLAAVGRNHIAPAKVTPRISLDCRNSC